MYKESPESLFSYLEKNYFQNDFENVLTLFIRKYLLFTDELLTTEIELCKSTNNEYKILLEIKKFLDIEKIYCFIFWGY
jgi:hypothetical protein